MAGQVVRCAVRTGDCENKPRVNLKGALQSHIAKHFAAVLDLVEAGAMSRAIDASTCQTEKVAALQLSALFFQRPGNIRAMEQAWVELDKRMLVIPANSMKSTKQEKLNGKPHTVPLARQALDVLKSITVLTDTDVTCSLAHAPLTGP